MASSQTDDQRGGISNEELEQRIYLYKNYLIKYVDGKQVYPYMADDFDTETKERIQNSETTAKSTEIMLKSLAKNTDSFCWRRFMEALQHSGYADMMQLISGNGLVKGDMIDQEKILNIFTVELCETIDPVSLCPYLEEKDVIRPYDREIIQAKQLQYGRTRAILYLLDRIPRYKSDWFDRFVQTLDERGHRRIARDLHPGYMSDMDEKGATTHIADEDDSDDEFVDAVDMISTQDHSLEKQTQHGEKQILDRDPKETEGYDSFATMEDHVSVDGPPQDSGKNMDPPDQPNTLSENLNKSENLSPKDVTDTLSENLNKSENLSPKDVTDTLNENLNTSENLSPKDVNARENKINETEEGHDNVSGFIKERRNRDVEKSYPKMNNLSTSNLKETNPSIKKTRKEIRALEAELKKSDTSIDAEEIIYARNDKVINRYDSDSGSDDDVTKEKQLAQRADSAAQEAEDQDEETKLKDSTLEKFEKVQKEHHEKIGMAPKMNVTVDEPPGKNQEVVVKKEELKLRSYQEDLASAALQGKNCIIVAPTGSGKTFVAMKIIDEHFKMHRRRKHPKVIFLTEQGALAQQQGDQMEKYLKYKVKVITGETQRQESFSSIKEWVNRRDILVVTAQLLVNAITMHDIEIQDFSLMVFDECHHAHAKHSYNQIMFDYLNLKLDDKCHASLPQIIGLTASVGVGKAKRLENAVDWIKSMMANLDSEEIQTVSKENERELMSHAQVPTESYFEVPSRKNDRFRRVIVKMMQTTENMMKESEFLPMVSQKEKVVKPPIQKGSEQYIQWVSELRRETAKVRNQDAHRFFLTCRNYLDMFNRTLIIYDYARVKDAIEFLKNELRKWQLGDQHDKTEQVMKDYLEETLPILNECQDDDNPKLTKLKASIDKAFYEQEESRGIVFVKTRDLVHAIVSWMKDTRGLKELKPAAFVGTHAPGDEGLTKAEQDNILQLFRQGGHKMIVATSVADEGLDIQECNLVIKYHQVTNEISMVQRRGRARKKESHVILFHEAGSGIAEKEELNMLREVMMNKAILVLRKSMTEDPQHFQNEILSQQIKDKAKRDLEAKTKNGRTHKEGDFELTCGKCREFICMSDEMRLIQRAHHAAICEDLSERIKAEVNPKPAYEDKKLMSGVGKVLCKNCGYDLGNISVYDNAQFAILKISNFSVKDVRGNFNTFRRWKQVPFHVKDIAEEEVEERLKGEKFIELM